MPHCPVCSSEVVDPSARFCPVCGADLQPPAPSAAPATAAAAVGPSASEERVPPRRSRAKRIVAAAVILAVLLAVAAYAVLPAAPPGHTVATTTSPPALCRGAAGEQTTVAAPVPDYDLQSVMIFNQSVSELEFNVTAIAQCDSSGYGPSYLLNGLSNSGFWYQVGVNYDWPLQPSGYQPGFYFVSEAWAPGGVTRAPVSIPFSGSVNSGDVVELNLTLGGGAVVTSARDLNTSATGSMSYPDQGTFFVGLAQQQSSRRFSFATQGYFTGLMTEWYHVNASGNVPQRAVVYSETLGNITAASLGVAEWNFTGATPGSVFSAVANGGSPVVLTGTLQNFTLNGYSVAADAHRFVTG